MNSLPERNALDIIFLQWYYSWHRTYFKGQILLVSWLLSPVSHLQLRGAALKQNFNSSITGHSQLSRETSEWILFYRVSTRRTVSYKSTVVCEIISHFLRHFRWFFKVRETFQLQWYLLLMPLIWGIIIWHFIILTLQKPGLVWSIRHWKKNTKLQLCRHRVQ